jgi:hypothetical protein
MRAKEFLIEKALDPSALFDPRHLNWRPAAFISKLHSGTPFVDKQGNEYYPEEGEGERLEPIVTKTVQDLTKNPLFKAPDIQVKIKDHGLMSTKKFEKADLQKVTGQSTTAVNVQPIGIGIATQPKAAIKGKKKETVTTDQAIQDALDAHKEIPAGKLYDVIISNPTLDTAGDLGQAIKQAATEINQNKNPSVKQYDDKTQSVIAIDAGEYLGILAMIKDVAEFPKKDAFLKFLKAPNFDNLALIFPGEQNASLADSYGVQNAKTGHTIMISSKGGKGSTASGAAPALSGLKASVAKRQNKIKPGNGLDFIDTINSNSTVRQGFAGWNWVAEHYPDRVPKYLRGVLPMSPETMDMVAYNIKMKGTTKLPASLLKFTKEPYMKPTKGTPGGTIVYFFTKELVKLVNEGLIPGFRETVLELLDENFMQIFTRIVGGKLVFKVLWPGKVDGNVSLYTKLSSADMSQALSFKVTD